ncbi:MAG: TolC family protein [Planctomycetota bacterium]
MGLSGGCRSTPNTSETCETTRSYHDHAALKIEYPDVQSCPTTVTAAAASTVAPLALQDPADLPTIDLTLLDAVRQAVQSSPVLRDLGGTVVAAPQATTTIYEPALAHANPLGGVEAALSDFDAQYTQSLFWEKVDQPQNRFSFVDPGPPAVLDFITSQRTQATFNNELSKRTATGATFSLRKSVAYTRTDDVSFQGQRFPSEFAGFIELEYRQPFMRGAGTQYNRIVGASAGVGQYNGVLIARANEDVALADFENAVITLVSDVEQAYWDLTTAYRVLEATLKGRQSALQTFQYQQVRLEVGTGRQDEEAQARSQFYQFEAQVQNALAGTAGLYALEQRLRYLIGMPATDGTLIRPSTEPLNAKVIFDWNDALGQALARRVEIRRQQVNVKRRELELYAARLNKRPQIDFVGSYRFRGLGDHLIGDGDNGLNDNFVDDVTNGNFQEWTAGFELAYPVGLRAASAAVAHARLNLNRERAVLSETQLRISHDLSDAARSIELRFQLMETNYNRYIADLRQVEVLRRRYLDGTDNINFLLQAQRQVVTSESEFYGSIADYNLSIRDFHQQKGSLLAYQQVGLAEGPWCAGTARDAYEMGRFMEPRFHPEKVTTPRPVSRGPFNPTEIQSTGHTTMPELSSTSHGDPAPGDAIPSPLGDLELIESPSS